MLNLSKKYFSPIIYITGLMGIFNGFVLMIICNTLNYWFAISNVKISEIGFFSIISLPYALSFLWTPLIEVKKIFFLNNIFGHYRSWLFLLTIFMVVIVNQLSFLQPQQNIYLISIFSLILAILGATIDSVMGGLRAKIVANNQPTNHYGPVAATYILGYRIGMLISKSGTVYLAYYLQWQSIFNILTLFILVIMTAILYMPIQNYNSDKYNNDIICTSNYLKTFSSTLKQLGSYKFISILLIFLFLYRLPDNLLAYMLNPFLIDKGYNALEISLSGYLYGSVAAIVGGIVAGSLLPHKGIYKCLYQFGIIHALSHCLFLLFNNKINTIYLSVIISIEGFTGGMAMASYIAAITFLSRGDFSSTKYSMMSSIMGLSRSIIPSFAGLIVLNLGWYYFYLIVFMLSIPSIIILKKFFAHYFDSHSILK